MNALVHYWHVFADWVRQRILAAALAAASVLAFLQLITPTWIDFFMDLLNVMLIAIAARMHRGKRRIPSGNQPGGEIEGRK